MKNKNWHVIKITRDEFNDSKHLEVKRRFEPHLPEIGKGVALFKTPMYSDEYNIYISPSDSPYVRSLIEDFNAVSCEAPSESVEYFAGDKNVKIM